MSDAESKYESWLRRTMNDPALNWARPRRVRRILVVAMVSLAVGFAAVMWAWPSLYWFAALLVVFIPLMGSLNGGIRGLTELRQHQLDEREGRARDAAFRKVFWPVVVMVAIAPFLVMADSIDVITRAGFGMAAFIVALTMPTLYLAWTLPDDIGEE
jgi:diacylglycerol kinase